MAKVYTIKEIAEKAKVSPGTVDRVLHNRGEVSEKTRKRVLKIIREGNYEPNIFARNLVLNKTYCIASLIPAHNPGTYWAGPFKGISRASEELKVLGIKNDFYFFEEEDPLAFERAARQALSEKPNGVLLAPVINRKVEWLSRFCAEMNIPLIIIDSETKRADPLSFIGQNAFKSGYLAGKLFHFAGTSKNIYVVTITMSTDNNAIFKERKKGFIAYYSDLNIAVNVIDIDLHAEDRDFDKQLESLANRILPGDKIFVSNSKVHLIAKALQKINNCNGVRIIGYDLIPKSVEFLNAGIIDFLINQKPEEQGYRGLHLFYKYLVLKQAIPSKIYMPLEIVTKENLEFVSG